MKKAVALLAMMLPAVCAHAAGPAVPLTDRQLDGVTAGSGLSLPCCTSTLLNNPITVSSALAGGSSSTGGSSGFSAPTITIPNFYSQSPAQQADILGDLGALTALGVPFKLGN